MKRYLITFVVSLLFGIALGVAPACTHAPPNLTPLATRAFYATQVIHDLDRVRDAANDAHKTVPPLIDAKDTLAIVQWHESAITVAHDAKDGWKTALDASIPALQKNLSPATWQVIAPYVTLVQNIIKEIQ